MLRDELWDLIQSAGPKGWSDHKLALALGLHVSRRTVINTHGKPEDRHCVTFSDLLMALSCLLSQDKLRSRLQNELILPDATAAEDKLEQDMELDTIVHRKIVAMQTTTANAMRRKIDSRIVDAMHPRRVRRGFGRAAAGKLRGNALAWNPDFLESSQP